MIYWHNILAALAFFCFLWLLVSERGCENIVLMHPKNCGQLGGGKCFYIYGATCWRRRRALKRNMALHSPTPSHAKKITDISGKLFLGYLKNANQYIAVCLRLVEYSGGSIANYSAPSIIRTIFEIIFWNHFLADPFAYAKTRIIEEGNFTYYSSWEIHFYHPKSS